jgi:hypothetical protein
VRDPKVRLRGLSEIAPNPPPAFDVYYESEYYESEPGRRSAADRGEHRQAAGAIAQAMTMRNWNCRRPFSHWSGRRISVASGSARAKAPDRFVAPSPRVIRGHTSLGI